MSKWKPIVIPVKPAKEQKFCDNPVCEWEAIKQANGYNLCAQCYQAFEMGMNNAPQPKKPRVVIRVKNGTARLESGGSKVDVVIKDCDNH
jgi:hypothetical protein